MRIKAKIDNAAEDMAGKAKELLGKVSGDRELEAEGRADQALSQVKKAGEHLRDAAKTAARK